MANSYHNTPENNIEVRHRMLSKCLLFSELSSEDINKLAKITQEVHYQANGRIVTQNDLVDSFYFIVKGKVEVTQKKTVDGFTNEIILATLEDGESIGLNSKGLFSLHGKRTATVTALVETSLLKINITDFNAFIKHHPRFSQELIEFTNKLIKVDFIKQSYPFAHLTLDEIISLTHEIKEIIFPANVLIFKEGDLSDCCYLVRDGQVEVFVTDENQKEKRLSIVDVPKLLGEAALMTASPRNASARTLVETKLLVIENRLMLEKMKNSKVFAQSLMGFMVNRFRPSWNKDVVVRQHVSDEGKLTVILHNTKLHRYYRLREEGWYIWQQLDGTLTIQDLTILVFKKYRVLVPEMICNLLYSLSENHFVNLPDIIDPHIETSSKTLWGRIKEKLNKIQQLEFSWINTDRVLTKIYNNGVFLLYNPIIQICFFLYCVIGIMTFFYSYPRIVQIIQHETISIWLFIPLLIVTSILSVILHESGHAFTAKRLGYKVERVGLGWFGLGPVAFVDLSELWVASKFYRLLVNTAGIYVDIIVAGTFSLLSLWLLNGAWSLYFWLLGLFIYFNAFKNFSPLSEYDGYFIVSDLLNSPGIRKSTIHWLHNINIQSLSDFYSFIKHRKQIYYLIICITYLMLSTLILFLFLEIIFKILAISSVLSIPSTFFSIILTTLILISSIRRIIDEIKRVGE